ncbi:hypothetical protein V5O48_016234, partial [Marasmius crinis-equi]
TGFPSPSGDDTNSQSSRQKSKAIIGGVVGGTVGLLVIGLLVLLLRRRSFISFQCLKSDHRRHESFHITVLPLPDSPLLQPTSFVIHRESPRTVAQNPPAETSPSPAEMRKWKERMLEDRPDTRAAGMEQPEEETGQNLTKPAQDQEESSEQTQDPKILARKLDIVVWRLAQLEARFDEEAPLDYTSNQS